MKSLNKDLILVVIASTINSSIKKLDNLTNESSIELDLDTFLSDLNELIVKYTREFNQKAIEAKIDRSALLSLMSEGKFGDFIQISENSIKIEANAKAFQAILSNIAVTSTLNYAKFLIKNIDDLGIIYRGSEATKLNSKNEEDANTNDNSNDTEKYTIEEVKEEKTKEEKNSENGEEDQLSAVDEVQEQENAEIKEAQAEADDEIGKDEDNTKPIQDSEKEDTQTEQIAEDKENDKSIQLGDNDELNEVDTVQNEVKEEQGEQTVDKEGNDLPECNIQSENEEALQETASSDLKENIETPEPKQPDSKDEARSQKKRSRSLSVSTPQQHKRFQHIAVNLINNIQAHRFSSPFLQPVNVKEAPDYHEVIYEPKDLKNILKSIKLKNDPPEYNLIKQLKRDILLMLANCIMYNKSDTDLVELTKSMKNDVNNIFKLFEEAELDTK